MIYIFISLLLRHYETMAGHQVEKDSRIFLAFLRQLSRHPGSAKETRVLYLYVCVLFQIGLEKKYVMRNMANVDSATISKIVN